MQEYISHGFPLDTDLIRERETDHVAGSRPGSKAFIVTEHELKWIERIQVDAERTKLVYRMALNAIKLSPEAKASFEQQFNNYHEAEYERRKAERQTDGKL